MPRCCSLDEPFIREVESHCEMDGVHISIHANPLISEMQTGNATPRGRMRKAPLRQYRCRAGEDGLSGDQGNPNLVHSGR
jgi:hypothetical protein